MYTVQLQYTNRTEYQVYASGWAAEQIARQWLKQDKNIVWAYIVNHDTYEVKKITR